MRGVIVYAPNLGWREVALRERLSATFGVPVVVDNDVRAAAWGEYGCVEQYASG